MAIYFEKIPLPADALFLLRSFEVPYMSYPMHHHQEIEITYIKKSYGQRFVGDHIEHFSNGDLVMIGANLPHQWQNDALFRQNDMQAELTVIHFREEVFGPLLSATNEFAHIRQLFIDSRRGIKFPKHLVPRFESALHQLEMAGKDDQFILFVSLLNVMAKSEDMEILSTSSIQEINTSKSIDKINTVYSYLLENYHQDIALSQAATLVHLSDSAFSHFIKKRTGMTFSALLNDLRVRYAGKLLKDTDLNVTEICYKVGYRNLSYFNRQFKNIKKCSPKDYRKKFDMEYLKNYDVHGELLTLDR